MKIVRPGPDAVYRIEVDPPPMWGASGPRATPEPDRRFILELSTSNFLHTDLILITFAAFPTFEPHHLRDSLSSSRPV